MKTIKIIDLLNKIAKGDNLPNKIKYYDTTYYLNDNDEKCYYTELPGHGGNSLYSAMWNIKDEVEIIKEDEQLTEDNEIEKLNIINGAVDGKSKNGSSYNYTLSAPQKVIIEKLNETIDSINDIYSILNEHIEEINKLKDDTK